MPRAIVSGSRVRLAPRKREGERRVYMYDLCQLMVFRVLADLRLALLFVLLSLACVACLVLCAFFLSLQFSIAANKRQIEMRFLLSYISASTLIIAPLLWWIEYVTYNCSLQCSLFSCDFTFRGLYDILSHLSNFEPIICLSFFKCLDLKFKHWK